MRLSEVLGFYTRYRKVQGLIRYGGTPSSSFALFFFIGLVIGWFYTCFHRVHRVIPPISTSLKKRVAEMMVREKTNLDILDKPYLSVAEESAFNKVVEKVPFKNDKELKQERRKNIIESLKPHYRTEDLLAHLNNDRRWE